MTSSSAAEDASVVSAPFAADMAAWAPAEATTLPQLLLSRARTCGSKGARTGSSQAALHSSTHQSGMLAPYVPDHLQPYHNKQQMQTRPTEVLITWDRPD